MKQIEWRRFSDAAACVPQKYKAALIVLLAGVLLLAANGGEKTAAAAPAEDTTAAAAAPSFELAAFEQQLAARLAAIEGVGQVELMLSLEQTEESVYANDIRQTANSGENTSYERAVTVVSDGSYGQSPVTVKQLLPTFRGAVVLCDGAGSTAVQLAVTQAVCTVCGVGADKVTVLKRAQAT